MSDKKSSVPERGTVFVAIRQVEHQQWKTSTLPANKWKNLPVGTELIFLEEESNFYGKFWKMIYPVTKEVYTVIPNRLRQKDDNQLAS